YLRRLPAGADQMSPGDARSGRPGPGPGAHRVEGRAQRPVPAHRDGDLAVADHRLRVGDGGLRLGLGRRRPQRLGNDLPHRGRTLGQLTVGEHLLGQLGPGEMVGRLPKHLRQAGTQRVADRRQQLAGRLLLAPLDLREVPERDVRGAGDLPQRPPLTLTPCAQGVTDHPTKQHRRLLPLSTACSQRYPLARTSASRPARVSQVTTGFQPHSGHAGTPDVRGRPAPEGPSSRSASSCSAAATVPARPAARSPDSRSDRTDGSPTGPTTATNTVPAPTPSAGPGPATPVVATAQSAPHRSRAPAAIAAATSASTGPRSASSPAGTPASVCFR